MLFLYEGAWKVSNQPDVYTKFVTRNSAFHNPLNTLYVNLHGNDLAPHFHSIFCYEGSRKVDVMLNGQTCTLESIEAFILALAIELQNRYNAGGIGYSIESNGLPEVIEKLRIEYLQPVQNSYVSSDVQVLTLRCTL